MLMIMPRKKEDAHEGVVRGGEGDVAISVE